jgi:hypothetical protein
MPADASTHEILMGGRQPKVPFLDERVLLHIRADPAGTGADADRTPAGPTSSSLVHRIERHADNGDMRSDSDTIETTAAVGVVLEQLTGESVG